MKQIAHSWIAVRAVGLLQEDRKTKGLAEILAPRVKESYIGCWLPDMSGFKKGHGYTKNHTFKMEPFNGNHAGRFIVEKKKLLKKIDSNTELHKYIKDDCSLPDSWWDKPYKADQPGGRHLPDCLSSLFDTTMDLILLGDAEVDRIVPGSPGYSGYLHPDISLAKEQISTFFFLMSHYIADCFMPCHCDNRRLASFSKKIHKQWEKHWDKIVGDNFSKKKLQATNDTSQQIIDKAKEVDDKLGLSFETPITLNMTGNIDMWETSIYWCRASFALSSNIFPQNKFPFGGDDAPKFGSHFSDKQALKEYDKIILQSAVYSVAGIWKKVWRKFKA